MPNTNQSPVIASRGPLLSTSLRLFVSMLAGIISAILVGVFVSGRYAPLAGWDIAAVIFLLWTWLALGGRDPEATASLSKQEDPGTAVADILLVLASVMSLAAVLVLLFQTGGTDPVIRILHVSLGIVSIMISWAVVHTIYILKYARVYYKNGGGINFHDTYPPAYSDFAYLGFTIGMTFQSSDTDLKTTEFRKIAIRHALLSYLFGTVIVATTINLIAGLGR